MQLKVMNKIVEGGNIARGSEKCREQGLNTTAMQVQTNLGAVAKAHPPVSREHPSKRNQTDCIPVNRGSPSSNDKEGVVESRIIPSMHPENTTAEAGRGEVSHHQQNHKSLEHQKQKPKTLTQTGVGNTSPSLGSQECGRIKEGEENKNSSKKFEHHNLCENVGEDVSTDAPIPVPKETESHEAVDNTLASLGPRRTGKDALPILATVAASAREDGNATVSQQPTSLSPQAPPKNKNSEHKVHAGINYTNLNLIATAASSQISKGEGNASGSTNVDGKSPNKDVEMNDSSKMTQSWQPGESTFPSAPMEQSEQAQGKTDEGDEHSVSDGSGICREGQQSKKKQGDEIDEIPPKISIPISLESYEKAWKNIRAKTIKNIAKAKAHKNMNTDEKKPGDEETAKTSAERTGTGDEIAEKDSLHIEKSDVLTKRRILENFKYAISRNKIEIQNDTSITGQFSVGLNRGSKGKGLDGQDKFKPYGFEPSTEKACQMEHYEVIKPSSPILTEKSNTTTTPDSKNYYQSWDPVAKKFQPKRRLYDDDGATSTSISADRNGYGRSSPYGNDRRGAGLLPLGAAAAGTRAALLSFMSAKTGLVSSAMPMNRFQACDMGLGGMASGGYIQTGIMPGTTIELPCEQSSFNVPEKVIIQPSMRSSNRRQLESSSSATTATITGRIVGDNDSGGKRIEQCSASTPTRTKSRGISNNTPSREKGRGTKRKKTSGRDDSSSFGEIGSSNKRSRNIDWDSDDGTGDMTAAVRRSKRRSAPKKHDS